MILMRELQETPVAVGHHQEESRERSPDGLTGANTVHHSQIASNEHNLTQFL